MLLSDLTHRDVFVVPTTWRSYASRLLKSSSFKWLNTSDQLVHNHPSGDPTPSAADVDMTRQVVDAGRTLRIAVHDHLVVGRQGVASFKALGLM